MIQARSRARVCAKVTRVTNSDTSSFFIPQPPPPQRPATTSPTCNTHLHEHPWPPTNHDNDNRLPTKHDNHMPTSPASTTTRAPSTSPRCHVTQPPPQTNTAAQNTTTAQSTPIRNEDSKRQTMSSTQRTTPTAQQQRRPPTTAVERPVPANDSVTNAHGRQRHVHPRPQPHERRNGRAGACRSQRRGTHATQTNEGRRRRRQ